MSDDPIVTAIVVGAVTGGAGFLISGSAFTAAAFGTAVVKGAVLAGASTALMTTLAPKPELPSLDSFGTTSQKDRQVSFRQPITSRKIAYGNIKLGGPIVYVTTTAKNGVANTYLHIVVVHCSHEINAIQSWFVDGKEIALSDVANGASGGNVTGGEFSGKIRINPHLGTDGQSADSDLVSEQPSEWTVNHTLSGMFYNYFRFEFDQEMFAGIPNIAVKIQGKKIFDPRTNSTSYSANSALVLRDYLTSSLGMNISSTEIDDTSFITAANVCDEDVTLANGSSEKRYEANGMIDTAVEPEKNIKEILSSMAGVLIYSNGKFKVIAGTTKTAVLSIDENDFSSSISINPRLSRRENFNAVKGQFVSPSNDFQPSDYPPVTSTAFQTEDNGEQIFRELNMPFTNSSAMAQRIAKQALFRARQPLSFQSTHKLSVLGLDVGDIANITFDRYGWSSKPFEVISWSFVINQNELGIAIEWREYADSVYSWSATEEQVIADAPNTSLPDVFNLQPPLNLTATESLTTTRDGRGVQSILDVTFDSAQDVFATEYEMEFKKSSDSVFISGGRTSALKFEILDLAPAIYNIRVKAVSSFGTSSPFNTINKEVFGLLAVPSALTNLSLQQGGGFAFLQWDRSTDLDVKIGGKVEIRHSNLSTGAVWMNSTEVDNSISGNATSAVVPLRAGTYLLKFVDSSGKKQTDATTVVTEGATILNYVNNTTINEHTGFNSIGATTTLASAITSTTATSVTVASASNLRNNDVILIGTEQILISSISSNTLTVVRGHRSTTKATHSNGADVLNTFNVFKDSSNRLTLTSSGLFDSVSSVDAISNFDFIGGVNSLGEYNFATALDLGSSTRVRLQADTTMQIFVANDLFDAIPDLNLRQDFDGTTDAVSADIQLYYQKSSDNVTFSEFKKFTSVEEQDRYFRFKAQLLSFDNSYSVRASTLSVKADVLS